MTKERTTSWLHKFVARQEYVPSVARFFLLFPRKSRFYANIIFLVKTCVCVCVYERVFVCVFIHRHTEQKTYVYKLDLTKRSAVCRPYFIIAQAVNLKFYPHHRPRGVVVINNILILEPAPSRERTLALPSSSTSLQSVENH